VGSVIHVLWGPGWTRLPFTAGTSTAITGAWPSPPVSARSGGGSCAAGAMIGTFGPLLGTRRSCLFAGEISLAARGRCLWVRGRPRLPFFGGQMREVLPQRGTTFPHQLCVQTSSRPLAAGGHDRPMAPSGTLKSCSFAGRKLRVFPDARILRARENRQLVTNRSRRFRVRAARVSAVLADLPNLGVHSREVLP
jgi:hypothetical protein